MKSRVVLAATLLLLPAVVRAQGVVSPDAPSDAPPDTPPVPPPDAPPVAPPDAAPVAPPVAGPARPAVMPPVVAPMVAPPVVAPVAPPVAPSLVQSRVYGFLNAQLERPWASGGATPYDGRFRVTDGGSRIGFTGTIALGRETSGLWQLEGALNGFEQGGLTDIGGSTSIVSRNSFVGVENRYLGRIVAGNNDSAYRRLIGSGGDMGGNLGLTIVGLDLWNNTSAQLSSTAKSIFGRGEERYRNSIHYVSPAWALFRTRHTLQFAGSYGFDEARVLATSRDRFAVAALYRFAGFSLGAAYDRQANTGVDVDTLQRGFGLNTVADNGVATTYYEATASYQSRFGTYVGVGVERSNYGFLQLMPPVPPNFYSTLNAGTLHQLGAMVSIAQAVHKVTLMASAGALLSLNNSFSGSGSDYRARQLSVGAKYEINDHFGTYVYFTAIQNGARQDVNLGAPIYSNNLGTAQAYLAPGDDPRSAAIGGVARF